MQTGMITCYSCGRELEHRMGTPPCEELTGWITISHWKGKESVDHYNFCSPLCLKQWIEGQSTPIPDVFLKSFEEDGDW